LVGAVVVVVVVAGGGLTGAGAAVVVVVVLAGISVVVGGFGWFTVVWEQPAAKASEAQVTAVMISFFMWLGFCYYFGTI
jgi:hypothetical protein